MTPIWKLRQKRGKSDAFGGFGGSKCQKIVFFILLEIVPVMFLRGSEVILDRLRASKAVFWEKYSRTQNFLKLAKTRLEDFWWWKFEKIDFLNFALDCFCGVSEAIWDHFGSLNGFKSCIFGKIHHRKISLKLVKSQNAFGGFWLHKLQKIDFP